MAASTATHLHRVEIAHDGKGKVLAWKHVIVGQSITMGTPFADFMVKNGADATMTEGVVESAYPFPIALDVHHPKVNVPVLWWRSVGHRTPAFVMETLVDEVARAGEDRSGGVPAASCSPSTRAIAALDLAVAKSSYGKTKLAKGRAWGVAVHESFNTVVAYVVEVVDQGRPAGAAQGDGRACTATSRSTRARSRRRCRARLVMGVGMTLPGAQITLKNGEVEQGNWNDYRVPIHVDAPKVDLHVVPSVDPPTGMGECGVPPIAPAMANAMAALTGKRIRVSPFPV